MIIQHNLQAMNANRQLNITGGKIAKSTRNLSSGYRINIAADDAAGLSISEKMRKQIRGLTKGIENTEDGISLCQVADGALAEVHDMLQRMNELAVKAANGTNSNSDRQDIDNEVSALLTEIDRIGETTRFNEVYIFKGRRPEKIQKESVSNPTAKGKFFQLIGSKNTSTTGYMQEPLSVDVMNKYITTSSIRGTTPYVSVHIDFKELIDDKKSIAKLAGAGFYVNCCTNCCPARVEFTNDTVISCNGRSSFKIGLKKADGGYYDSAKEFVNAVVGKLKTSNQSAHVEFACDPNGTTLYLYDIDNNNWSETNKKMAYFCDIPSDETIGTTNVISGGVDQYNLWIQSGCDAGDGLVLDVNSMNTAVLNIDLINVLTERNAENAIDQISIAIQKISDQRSRIGAYQNRLEHTIMNEENIVENTTAAESKIRDADMATEMVKYSNTNILQQAGQSMLTQSNQSRQGILSLLAA